MLSARTLLVGETCPVFGSVILADSCMFLLGVLLTLSEVMSGIKMVMLLLLDTLFIMLRCTVVPREDLSSPVPLPPSPLLLVWLRLLLFLLLPFLLLPLLLLLCRLALRRFPVWLPPPTPPPSSSPPPLPPSPRSSSSSSPSPPPHYADGGSSCGYVGPYRMVSWNSQALFAVDSYKAQARLRTLRKLAHSFDVVALQETHGSDDTSCSLDPLVTRACHPFWSHVSQQEAGVGVLVNKLFVSKWFDLAPPEWVVYIPGRLASLTFCGTSGTLQIFVVYAHADDVGARTRLMLNIARHLPHSHSCSGVVCGDFNYVECSLTGMTLTPTLSVETAMLLNMLGIARKFGILVVTLALISQT